MDAAGPLGTPGAPPALRPFARWPASLEVLWERLEPAVDSAGWPPAAAAIRRSLLSGLDLLPHPVALQWAALHERGFGEPERRRMVELLESHDSPAAGQTLAAAYAWRAFGSPELGQEA